MTVPAEVLHAEDQPSREWLALFVAFAGCVALAVRPPILWAGFGVTMTVGLAGALGPGSLEPTADTPRRAAMWFGATLLGVVAFASVRFASSIPPAPASLRYASMAVVAAVAEELFFRRFLYGALARHGAAVAVTGSAIAFALVHIPAYGRGVFPIDLAAGFVLSWQRWATGSWTASAASHAAANLMAIL